MKEYDANGKEADRGRKRGRDGEREKEVERRESVNERERLGVFRLDTQPLPNDYNI